jgi:hypothetical protein
MSGRTTYQDIIQRLSEHRIGHAVVGLQDGVTVVVSQLGGRIFGPFIPGLDWGLMWTSPVFGDAVRFEVAVRDREWNLGGDRVWVAPAVQFLLPERPAEPGVAQYEPPPAMDPGYFSLSQASGQPDGAAWTLSQAMTLEATNLASGLKTLRIERTIRPIANPLEASSHCDELMDGVLFAGYDQEISLSEARSDHILSAWWSAFNVTPGGEALVALTPGAEYDDHGAPAPPTHHTFTARAARVRMTGEHSFAIGYRAPYVVGRIAYLNTLGDNYSYLIVRSFFSDPSGPYLEEPPHEPGVCGSSTFVASRIAIDDCAGELSCQGAAIGGETGRSRAVDRVPMWLFAGVTARIRDIGSILLGLDL